MPPVRKKRVSSKKSKNSDTSVVQNASNTELTFDEVKEKLRKQCIRAPSAFTKEQLLELLNENTGQDNAVIPEIPALTQLTTIKEANNISEPAVVSERNNGVLYDTEAYNTAKVSAGMFPHVQAVAPNVWKQILEGKYINLATLLNNQENKPPVESNGRDDSNTDIRGCPVLFFRGRKVCNNFLSNKCFKGTKFLFAHVSARSSSGTSPNSRPSQEQAQAKN
ncbi:unnamed protein product [Mytilus coruscus]|uniref:C3H1-type domain-containing protein n=1 Tax=Mytilus coruscus TaxID=42192 RepID=A0A6J8BYJ2_MYTCO|nr:unnamed protein product [Mytilus coruscus]